MWSLLFQMKIEDEEKLIKELEVRLQRSTMETDRKLTQQQQESEKKIQLLMHQLSEAQTTNNNNTTTTVNGETSSEKDSK